MLIVLSGLPATGKTAIATEVARSLGAVLLSVDPIDSALAEVGTRETEIPGIAAYAVIGAMAEQNLEIGATVVVDAVNAVGEAKTFWIELARRLDARLLAIEVILADEQIHRRRLAGRVRQLAIAEPTWEAVIQRRAEWVAWPFAPLVVDAAEALDRNVSRVLEAARTVAADRSALAAGSTRGAGDNRAGDKETPEGTPGP